jgi:hypothetical protein
MHPWCEKNLCKNYKGQTTLLIDADGVKRHPAYWTAAHIM